MKYRKLRIAWSVGCGIACVLLIVLYVRSYWLWDSLVWGVTAKQGVLACSQSGRTMLQYLDFRGAPASINATIFKWKLQNYPPGGKSSLPPSVAGFFVEKSDAQLGVPYWFLIVVLAAVTSVPWLPWIHWRFTLRTLLIAMTLIAAVLGAIVYLTRQ